jgi:hypothetical protein
MDFIAIAETLEAQAASLRRHAAELAAEGQGALELDVPAAGGWHEWEGGDTPPAEAMGRNVDVQLRDGDVISGPAAALTWGWEHNAAAHPENEGRRDIVEYRISAEQPDE